MGDDDWFKPIGRGRETLGQRLRPTIAEGTSIDTTAGTEYSDWVEPDTFSGCIATFAGGKEESAEKAKKHTEGPDELSLWMDGSRLDSGSIQASVA